MKLTNSQTLLSDAVETGAFFLDFAQQMRRKKADASDIYFTALDAAGISPTLILNQNAKPEPGTLKQGPKKVRKLGPFQELNARCWKGCTYRVRLLMGL